MISKLETGNFFAPVGNSDEYGPVTIFQHAHIFKHECENSILSKAREEGFKGSLSDWLANLGWEIKEFSCAEVFQKRTVGSFCEMCREEAGLNQSEVEALIDSMALNDVKVSQQTIGKIERGVVENPGVFTVGNLLAAYGKTLMDLNRYLEGKD